MQELNIVELIEKNPISKLSKVYNNKLISKIQENFTGFEQQLFVSSFYCYLNYDKNLDFVVDLDNVWKWLGFSTKQKSEMLLEKHFKINIDYKNLAFPSEKAVLNEKKLLNLKDKQDSSIKYVKQNGGHNKQTILLTIKCFKSLCLKAQTSKASEIHEYYMKMEEVLHKIIEEETDELKLQLQQKENVILEIKQEKQQLLQTSKKEKQKAVEQAIIVHFPLNTECIYIGTIDNTNEANEKLIKFGHTNDLATRMNDHRKGYTNFELIDAFKVHNKVEIENLIKNHSKIKKQIRSIQLNGKNKTELIAYDETDFTSEKLIKIIKDIIHSKTYSIENFNRIMKLNEDLEYKIREIESENKKLEIENRELKIENLKLKEQQQIIIQQPVENIVTQISQAENDMDKKFNEFVNNICIVRSDVEEFSTDLEGRYRLWSQVKPTKEVFHAFKTYLDARFKPKRIGTNHGYGGIKLKPAEYKKSKENSDAETFIFQACQFSDTGKVLNSVLLSEYQKWKQSVGKELSENDMKELKEYLNQSPYALKAVVWTKDGNNEGYYGLSIKENIHKPKLISCTGKKVYKREEKTNLLLATWETIAKAAVAEGISTARMSRCVKNKTIVDDYYYSVI